MECPAVPFRNLSQHLWTNPTPILIPKFHLARDRQYNEHAWKSHRCCTFESKLFKRIIIFTVTTGEESSTGSKIRTSMSGKYIYSKITLKLCYMNVYLKHACMSFFEEQNYCIWQLQTRQKELKLLKRFVSIIMSTCPKRLLISVSVMSLVVGRSL